MSFYRTHIFVCENVRTDGTACCAHNAPQLPEGENAVRFMRKLLKAEGAHGKGRVRVNRAGCFDRCQEGPVLVVYPQGRWYRYESEADLREIVQQEVLGGKAVARLQL